MPNSTRPQKITFAEMRSSGVRGLLIYCSDYKCSHSTTMRARKDGQMTFDFPILSRYSSVRRAGKEAPMSGLTLVGKKRPDAR
jgi:hypothetical protein